MGFLKVDGMDTVMVIVDRFLKYDVFVVAPSVYTVEVVAGLFFKHMVRYFGVPSDVVSSSDVRFTQRFWIVMFRLVGKRLKFLTTNHSQTNGQMERINVLLEEYLRHYVTTTQKNWLKLFDSA